MYIGSLEWLRCLLSETSHCPLCLSPACLSVSAIRQSKHGRASPRPWQDHRLDIFLKQDHLRMNVTSHQQSSQVYRPDLGRIITQTSLITCYYIILCLIWAGKWKIVTSQKQQFDGPSHPACQIYICVCLRQHSVIVGAGLWMVRSGLVTPARQPPTLICQSGWNVSNCSTPPGCQSATARLLSSPRALT